MPDTKTHQILIIDDDSANISLIRSILETSKDSYSFLTSDNGLEGCQLAKDNHPDLIILDWQMPHFDGMDVIRELKLHKESMRIPVMFTSGVMTKSKDLHKALEEGAIDFVRKPIEALELIARTKAILQLSDYHKMVLEQKNKELALHAMYLRKNSEFGTQLIKMLNELDKAMEDNNGAAHNQLKQIVQEVSVNNNQHIVKHFEDYFVELNPGYTSKLLQQFPKLSPAEIRLSIFLRMNMSSKDIANILCQSNDSIKVARKRLRKKLNLKSKENLTTFLMSI